MTVFITVDENGCRIGCAFPGSRRNRISQYKNPDPVGSAWHPIIGFRSNAIQANNNVFLLHFNILFLVYNIYSITVNAIFPPPTYI